jgi:O-antigen ligase
VAYVLAACIGLAALLTYSRGGALALALVAFLALVARGVRPSRLVALIVVLGLVASLFPGSAVTRRLTTLAELLPGREVLHLDSSIEKRKLLGMVAWQMFLDHPLLGVGVGNFSTHYAPYSEDVGSESRRYVDPDERQYPHNLYLEIGAETGMVGVAGLILVIGAALSQLRIARERFRLRGDTLSAALSSAFSVAIAGFLISSLFLHGHFERYLWLLFAFSSALYSCARRPIHHGEPGRGSHP